MSDCLHINRAGDVAWKTLGAIRLINGTLALVAPRWLAHRLGVKPESQPAVLYVLRMFGVRTVLLGADLWLNPGARPRSLRQGIVIHASDTTAALIATGFGQLPFRAGLNTVVISSINTALAIFASSRSARRQ